MYVGHRVQRVCVMRVTDKQIGQPLAQDPGARQFSLRDFNRITATNQWDSARPKLLPESWLQYIHIVEKCPGIVSGRVAAGR